MEEVSSFFKDNIVAVFFLHGLALFLMGVLVTLESRRGFSSGLPHILRPLGVFGILGGLSEWLEMFIAIPRTTAGPDVGLVLHQIQPSNCLECHPGPAQAVHAGQSAGDLYHTLGFILILLSVFFLIYFGSRLLLHTGLSGWYIRYLPLSSLLLWALAAGSCIGIDPASFTEWRGAASIYYRYFLYFPGAMLAALGLWRLYCTSLKKRLPRAGLAARAAAGLFTLSGVFDGLIVAPATFPPASLLNYASFFDLVGVPVQLFRATIVIGIAFCIVRILREWDVERTRQVTETLSERLRLQQEATESEARQREQAERWNQELRRERELRGEVLKRVITAQEDERKRVARELHDEMGQTLTALSTGLEAIAIALDKDPRLARGQLSRLQGFAQSATADVHRLIADLRPALLDDLGLPSALRWYASMASEQGEFEVHLEATGPNRRLPPHLETVLFRIAQEALTNVIRHAGARHVEIKLHCNDELVLEVEDDGRGFDVGAVLNRAEGREAVGLLGMRERARMAGGELDLVSTPGQGSRVTVRLPLLE